MWKTMHLQPLFNPQITQSPQITQITQITQIAPINGGKKVQNTQKKKKQYPCRVVGGEVAEDLFNRGLCLPSGTQMTNSDLDRVIEVIRKAKKG